MISLSVLSFLLDSAPLMILITAALFALYLGLAIADLKKRHLLSRGAVYSLTMLLAPAAVLAAVLTAVSAFLVLGMLAAFGALILCAALVVIVVVVYIRGHIFPADRAADKAKYTDAYGKFAAKRAMVTGIVGFFIYFALFCVLVGDLIRVATSLFGDNTLFENGIILIALLLLLFIPIFCLIPIVLFISVGTEIVAIIIAAILALAMSLLITNGCIRYIITTDKPKFNKALWILLSIVPFANIVMGISYSIKISRIL